jgi:hypothetical protein
MTVLDAVREAITGRWMTALEVEDYIWPRVGGTQTGSAVTARIRELRNPRSPNRMAYNVQTRKAPNSNAFEYFIAKGRKK